MTISEDLLRSFVDGLKQSATAMERAASTSERIADAVQASTEASERRQTAIIDSMQELHYQRDKAVESIVTRVNEHADKNLDDREVWWKRWATLTLAAITLAALFQVPIGRLISAVLGIKP